MDWLYKFSQVISEKNVALWHPNELSNLPSEVRNLPKYPDVQYVERDWRTGDLEKFFGKPLYFEAKYDGSNIRLALVQNKILVSTRNRDVAVDVFIGGFLTAFDGIYDKLINILSKEYVIFCELYGNRNTPQGIHKNHPKDWDYVVFDLWHPEKGWIPPEEATKILGDLKFVEYVKDTANSFEEMVKKAKKYSKHEGVVIKFYENGKFHATKWKPEEIKNNVLPKSEILGCINKAHQILGDEIFNSKKAMRLIAKLVKKEAKKHGLRRPSSDYVYRLYNIYIKQLQSSR